jgi:hypothetical protein
MRRKIRIMVKGNWRAEAFFYIPDKTRRASRSQDMLIEADGLRQQLKLPAARCSTLSAMDVLKMLAELRAEREQVEEAILILERVARGGWQASGRPPKWMTGMKRRGRPPGSNNKPK